MKEGYEFAGVNSTLFFIFFGKSKFNLIIDKNDQMDRSTIQFSFKEKVLFNLKNRRFLVSKLSTIYFKN